MLTILIVDDTPVVLMGTAMVLAQLGFDAVMSASGAEALEKLGNADFDGILMDYNMPNMTGFECTAKIRATERATGKRTPIIGMTASTDSNIREQCISSGMDDYVSKDCTNEELQAVLSKWVGIKDSVAIKQQSNSILTNS